MTTQHANNAKYSAHVHRACPHKSSQHLEMFSNSASARLSSNQTSKLKLKCVLLDRCTSVMRLTDHNGNLVKAYWSHLQQLIIRVQRFPWTFAISGGHNPHYHDQVYNLLHWISYYGDQKCTPWITLPNIFTHIWVIRHLKFVHLEVRNPIQETE